MNTHDRFKVLRKKLGLKGVFYYPDHSDLDILDTAADFCSLVVPAYGCGNYDVKNYLGARLARLERHVFLDPKNVTYLRGKKTRRGWRTRALYYFWLGYEADEPYLCKCGCNELKRAPVDFEHLFMTKSLEIGRYEMSDGSVLPDIVVKYDAPGG